MKASAVHENLSATPRPIALRKSESTQVIQLHDLLIEGCGSPGQSALLVARNGPRLEILRAISSVLVVAAETMAQGDAVSIVPARHALTTQQAADLLNPSRPHLVKLLERSDVPRRKTGSHWRIYFEDLRRYRDLRDTQRRQAFREFTRKSAEYGLEYRTWAGRRCSMRASSAPSRHAIAGAGRSSLRCAAT